MKELSQICSLQEAKRLDLFNLVRTSYVIKSWSELMQNGNWVKHVCLPEIGRESIQGMITSVRAFTYGLQADFSGHPVRTIFNPEPEFRASMHAMVLDSGFEQEMHRHNCGRHIICFGDIPFQFEYAPPGDRVTSVHSLNMSAFVPQFIRFEALVWHKFKVSEERGLGVVAISFHDLDDVVSDAIDLMTQLTRFAK